MFHIFTLKLFFINITRFLHFSMIPPSLLLIVSLFFKKKLVIFFAGSLKGSQLFHTIFTSHAYVLFLNNDIVDIENYHFRCLPALLIRS